MKKVILASLVALGVSSNAQADAIGLYLGASYWDQASSGEFGSSSQQVDFNLADEQQTSYFISVEHPLPLIPNAKISQATLQSDGQALLTTEFEFNNTTFESNSTAMANFDVKFTDYTLYYELFDNDLLSFDFGITGRDFSGSVSISGEINGSVETSRISTDEIVPMLYARTNIGLPFTGFNFFAEGNFLSVKDHTLYDYQAGISYELVDNLAIDINITMGYREVKLTLDDLNNLYSDITFNGAFLGTVVHF